MNILPFEKQVQCIASLTEGCSIRATERLTDIHRDTIMRLDLRVGEGCAALHDRMMTDLQVGHIELDEIWAFVAKKQRRVTSADPSSVGDQYLYTAMDATGKAILSYVVGKRNAKNTRDFLADLRTRVINRPNISSDAFTQYPEAIELAFGADVDYGQIQKSYTEDANEPKRVRRYSPGAVVAVATRTVVGDPDQICTSHMGARKPHHQDADKALHTPHQRLLEKAPQPQGGGRAVHSPLQPMPGPQDDPHDTSDDARLGRSYLERGRVDRGRCELGFAQIAWTSRWPPASHRRESVLVCGGHVS